MSKDYKYTGHNKELTEFARDLRKNMTKEEAHLWHDFLKKRQEKWYRQRPIEQYIVDFYCPKTKTVVEIDGSQHYSSNGREQDAVRTEILEQHGIEVIRFSNRDINENFNGVCLYIENRIKQKIQG